MPHLRSGTLGIRDPGKAGGRLVPVLQPCSGFLPPLSSSQKPIPRHPRRPDFQGPQSLGQHLPREGHFTSFEPQFSHLQDEHDGNHLRFLWSCYLAPTPCPPSSESVLRTHLCRVFLSLRHLKRHTAVDAKRQFAELNSMGYDDDEEMKCA